jgi:hypothetical protein
MTEAEWLASDDGQEMRQCLRKQFNAARRKIGRRKLRLFACACCRQVWDAMTDERSRAAVEFAERLADGGADTVRLNSLRNDAAAAASEAGFCQESNDYDWEAPGSRAASAASGAVSKQPLECVGSHWAIRRHLEPGDEAAYREWRAGHREVAGLFRDIFGNPFHLVTIPPSHCTPTVVSLARAAYDGRHLPSGELDPQRLAVLSDALEEAGAPGELLEHLRGPGPHVRGCWAVDLCLGLS